MQWNCTKCIALLIPAYIAVHFAIAVLDEPGPGELRSSWADPVAWTPFILLMLIFGVVGDTVSWLRQRRRR